MNKPDNITPIDWKLLTNKYSDEYINQKLKASYPIQYLIGDINFYGYKILVDERVFIPRPETELLVDKIIKYTKKSNLKEPTILDICTGSGAIAIALANEIKNSYVTGVDINSKSLELSKENAKINNADITFIEADILNAEEIDYFDIVVCNPPYISQDEKVAKETKYEPQIALFAEDNGLKFYKHIIKTVNKKTPIIAFEIGESQGDKIKKIATEYFPGHKITVENDLAGRNRYIFIIKNKNNV